MYSDWKFSPDNFSDQPFQDSHQQPQQDETTQVTFTPEQNRAMQVFRDNLYQQAEKTTQVIDLPSVATTNSMLFIDGFLKTKKMPREPNWSWNQSVPRVSYQFNQYDVSFFKLNTRKARTGSGKAPSYKVWIFHAKFQHQEFSFLWCEKGEVSTP